jgi:hypothetical protein
MEKQKRRLEEDKQAAISLLEVRNQEYAREKEEKEKLMNKIKVLSS